MGHTEGDEVRWNTSQGTTDGTLIEKKVRTFVFKGQKFKPTNDDPYWIVESASTGVQAAHKQSSLEKKGE